MRRARHRRWADLLKCCSERPAELQLRCTVQPLVQCVCRLCFDSVKWRILALVSCAGIIFVRVILSCAVFSSPQKDIMHNNLLIGVEASACRVGQRWLEGLLFCAESWRHIDCFPRQQSRWTPKFVWDQTFSVYNLCDNWYAASLPVTLCSRYVFGRSVRSAIGFLAKQT